MAALRRGRRRRARGHHRHRGRHRRPQRDGDARRGRRALRHQPAAPAARPGRARRARVAVPALRAQGQSRGCRRWPSTPTASGWPRSTSSCAARASWPARGSPGWRASAFARLPEDAALAERGQGLRRGAARRSIPSWRSPSTRCWPASSPALTAPSSCRRCRHEVVRVVAGRHGGRRLVAPPGDATRPTSDRVREALFSVLGPLDGARVLDLYAGSGALGIEALSRGAASAVFVERAARAVSAIRTNLEALGIEAEVRRMDGPHGTARRIGAGRRIRSGLPRPSLPACRRAGTGALRGAGPGPRARRAHRQRERPSHPARAGPPGERRAPLRRHPHPHP